MTVDNPTVVDSVARSADGQVFSLLMTEDRLFEDSDERLDQLMQKINAYVEYLQLGQFLEDFPEARGLGVKVVLVCRDEPVGDRFARLLGAANYLFTKHGAEFVVNVIPNELTRLWGAG